MAFPFPAVSVRTTSREMVYTARTQGPPCTASEARTAPTMLTACLRGEGTVSGTITPSNQYTVFSLGAKTVDQKTFFRQNG